ncbi:MAG TPA: ABC transporter ATP-binding protein [Streptosporangiaceae bacterium]|nr:ABC transporter ATP-binding protein [Streptosporangiaceae bacterium]
MTTTDAVLRASGISVAFGGVRALSDVDLEVGPGRLVGLIGPNGAGKTTFIDAISGFVRCRGRVELAGRDLSTAPPHARARRGLARTWQSVELFDDLTVRENLAVATAHRQPLWAGIKETVSRSASATPALDDALALLGLEGDADRLATDLPQGKRKLVGVARALAARPRLLCLDEPAAGLDVAESADLGRHLRAVVDAGTATLLVDHDMGLVLSVCDHVVVLNFGEVIAQGPPDVVRGDPGVVAAYLGSAAAEVVEEAR